MTGRAWRCIVFVVGLIMLPALALAQGVPAIRWLGGGHTDVIAVAVSPDGQTVASGGDVNFGSGDVNVKLWRVSDGALVRTFVGAETICYTLAFSPDGTRLAAGKGYDIEIFRVSSGARLRTLTGHTFSVFSVAF